jgi:hypothetical protein
MEDPEISKFLRSAGPDNDGGFACVHATGANAIDWRAPGNCVYFEGGCKVPAFFAKDRSQLLLSSNSSEKTNQNKPRLVEHKTKGRTPLTPLMNHSEYISYHPSEDAAIRYVVEITVSDSM